MVIGPMPPTHHDQIRVRESHKADRAVSSQPKRPRRAPRDNVLDRDAEPRTLSAPARPIRL